MTPHRNPARRPASNGPGAVAGPEPVAKSASVAGVVAAVLAVGAVLGFDLEEAQVTAIVGGLFALAGLVATIKARRSVTPNSRVIEATSTPK